jgi:hypothetical protein
MHVTGRAVTISQINEYALKMTNAYSWFGLVAYSLLGAAQGVSPKRSASAASAPQKTWQDFLGEAKNRVAEAKAKYGVADDAVMTAGEKPQGGTGDALQERKLQVTSWASRGATPDLAPGRWVQLGGPTRLNFLKTGLIGPKAYLSDRFPYLRLSRSNVPFSNSITGKVPSSSLSWPTGIEAWKGLLGQRILKP